MNRMRAAWFGLLVACSFRIAPDGAAPPSDAAIDGGVDAPEVTADAPGCPAGFVPVAGAPATSRYRVFGHQSYDDAVATCATLGTHLLQLDTQEEADALEELIDAETASVDTRIYRVVGRRDRDPEPDAWLGRDGVTPLTFLPWGAGEPTSLTGEDCMSLREENGASATKVIGADLCTTLHEFACECE